MTSSMPIPDFSPGLARTLPTMFQSSGIPVFNNNRLYPDVLVDDMKNKLLGGYHRVQHAISRYIPNAARGTATPEVDTIPHPNMLYEQSLTFSFQSFDLESQPENDWQARNVSLEPAVTSLQPPYNLNKPFPTQADYSEVEGVQPAVFPKRTRTWMVALIVGVLSLIVVPGLVVGVITRQMSLGVELSGAIAPIVSLLAGLYYHHNK